MATILAPGLQGSRKLSIKRLSTFLYFPMFITRDKPVGLTLYAWIVILYSFIQEKGKEISNI